MRRPGLRLPFILSLSLVAPLLIAGVWRDVTADDWRTASRLPTGIAPNPATTPEAVVQVYAARAWGWRGVFGVHTWIAVKSQGASAFDVYEAIGWRLFSGEPAVVRHRQAPDARWYGNAPEIIAELRGPAAVETIPLIDRAARVYPYADQYHPWPGPNSNTFTAFLARAAPRLRVDLPPTAIGKDYLAHGLLAPAPSGTGWQFSYLGLFGILAARVEGLEVDILGLTFGVNPFAPSLKLPVIGRIGAAPRG